MEIIKGVHMLECTGRSRVYLIQGEENILIDTSLPIPRLADKIVEEVKSLGIDIKSIKHILLTHHDVDHVGNAAALQKLTGAALWAPKEDVPYINGELKRPGVKKIVQILVKYEIPKVDKTYAHDQVIGDIAVINTPGHTPGHASFLYKNVIFTGDLFKVKNEDFKTMPKFMNYNQLLVKKSLEKIKDLEFDWVCPSHGSPIKRNDRLENLTI
ncbi:MAG: MBL fold metallo-hydrolase [Bacillota bacterium]|nr:MBL fold metallo-hydrolase [Bacillota bacterium]